MHIHPTAIVHPSAELGHDVEIQAFSIVEEQAQIGPRSIIGPHCVIGAGTVLGSGTRTFSGASIGVSPQDLKHVPGAMGKTIIGDNNVFREAVTVSSGTVYREQAEESVTRIGSNCLFMACSHVAHDCVVGDNVILANSVALAGHVTVHDRVLSAG